MSDIAASAARTIAAALREQADSMEAKLVTIIGEDAKSADVRRRGQEIIVKSLQLASRWDQKGASSGLNHA